MSKKGIYDNTKIRRNNQKYNTRGIQECNQSLVAADIKRNNNKDKISHNFDEKLFIKGREWFESGLPLKDAPEDMKKNVSFISGFRKGQRLQLINDTLYETGVDFYNRGVLLEDAPINYRDNEYFKAGYKDAKERKR